MKKSSKIIIITGISIIFLLVLISIIYKLLYLFIIIIFPLISFSAVVFIVFICIIGATVGEDIDDYWSWDEL